MVRNHCNGFWLWFGYGESSEEVKGEVKSQLKGPIKEYFNLVFYLKMVH